AGKDRPADAIILPHSPARAVAAGPEREGQPVEGLPMRVVCTKEFNCTPERLWPFLAEPEQQKRWMKGLLENTRTGPGPDGVGSTFRMKIKEGGRVQEYDGETVAFAPPRHLAVRFWGGAFKEGMVVHVDYRLTPGDGRTRLDYVCEIQAK